MTGEARHKIILKLNQQQIELIERTIARGAAADIGALCQRALREYAARHPTEPENNHG
jgi:hypothetical protein